MKGYRTQCHCVPQPFLQYFCRLYKTTHLVHLNVRLYAVSFAISPYIFKILPPTSMTSNCTQRFLLPLLLASICLASANVHAATANINCQPGSFRISDGSKCKKCPPGKFQFRSNQTSCESCPRETYNRYSGAWHPSLCLPCRWPLATARRGSSQCTVCRPGKFAECGKCQRCPPGTSLKCGRCADCPFGSVSADFNQLSCEDCPIGMRPSQNRTMCLPDKCPAGSEYNLDYDVSQTSMEPGSDCAICGYMGLNFYRSSSMKTCEECRGRRVVTSSNRPSGCVSCKPGTFMDSKVSSFSHFEPFRFCTPCKNGTTTKGKGKLMCRAEGSKCPKGYFVDADGDCERCLKDERVDTSLNRCVACPSNSTSAGGTVKKCKPLFVRRLRCLPGQTSDKFELDQIQNGCTCPFRTWQHTHTGKCIPCDKKSRKMACVICGEGSIMNSKGECIRCPLGSYNGQNEGTRCKKQRVCPPGFELPGLNDLRISHFGPNTCVSGRTGCPRRLRARTFSQGFFPRALCEDPKTGKAVCPPGLRFNGVDGCVRCDEGQRLSRREGKLVCVLCPKNSISNGGLTWKCEMCPKGYVDFNRKRCGCPVGRYLNKSGKCVKCLSPGLLTERTAPIGCIYNAPGVHYF